VYAIKASTAENLDRGYKNRNFCTLPDSQAAIKSPENYQITSKLVWGCHISLVNLAKHDRVQLIWVPGHKGIEGNETANQLARLGSKCPFTELEPAYSNSAGISKKAVRDWTNRDLCSGRWAYTDDDDDDDDNLFLVHQCFAAL
jgi:hypothetical protein